MVQGGFDPGGESLRIDQCSVFVEELPGQREENGVANRDRVQFHQDQTELLHRTHATASPPV
jgi:hypothetical protein